VGRAVAPLNRIWVAAALVALAAVTGAAFLLRRNDAGGGDTGSGIQVRYDVVDLTTQQRTVETVELQRPLVSRRVSGATGSATTERGVFGRFDGHWRQVAATPPGEIGQDLRLAAALAWARGHGLAAQDGTGRVAGRPCTWWLTKEPLDVAAFAAATADDRARTCVGADGLLLADTWRGGGSDLRRRTATQVRRIRSVDALDGETPPALNPELVLTVVERLDAPANDLVRLTPPAGLRARAACRWSDLAPGTTDVTRRAVRAVYADDSDVLVVDQLRGPADAPGVPAELGALGQGRVQATGGGLVVTVPLADQQLLRVRTSLPYDALLAWLRTLRRR
jgi:hypothetical protein